MLIYIQILIVNSNYPFMFNREMFYNFFFTLLNVIVIDRTFLISYLNSYYKITVVNI